MKVHDLILFNPLHQAGGDLQLGYVARLPAANDPAHCEVHLFALGHATTVETAKILFVFSATATPWAAKTEARLKGEQVAYFESLGYHHDLRLRNEYHASVVQGLKGSTGWPASDIARAVVRDAYFAAEALRTPEEQEAFIDEEYADHLKADAAKTQSLRVEQAEEDTQQVLPAQMLADDAAAKAEQASELQRIADEGQARAREMAASGVRLNDHRTHDRTDGWTKNCPACIAERKTRELLEEQLGR